MPAVVQDRSCCPSTNRPAQPERPLLQTMTTPLTANNIKNSNSKNSNNGININTSIMNSTSINKKQGTSNKSVAELEPLDVSQFSALGGLYGSSASNERQLQHYFEGGYQNLSINDGTLTPVSNSSVVINLFVDDGESSRRVSTSSWLAPILPGGCGSGSGHPNGENNGADQPGDTSFYMNSYKYPKEVNLASMKSTGGAPHKGHPNQLPIIYGSGGHSAMSGSGIHNVSMFWTTVQVMVAFLIAGFGNVGAGLILDYCQQWQVFIYVRELFVLVPSLLGLKGNLEMTMASRLSTQANLGHMNNNKELWKMVKGNLALVQCQATVVSFVVAIFASTVNSMSSGEPMDFKSTMILCSSSLLTANIACFVLGSAMILVIVFSHKISVDPDNIAAPVAASLGDMTTAALLAIFAHLIYKYTQEQTVPYLAIIITLAFLLMLPVWIYIARTNTYTSDVITKGWTPIVVAVMISSCGGFILDYGKSQYSRLPVFQPVVNGVGGNLVAVQASRLSTSLHRHGKPGELAPGFKIFTGPIEAFIGRHDVNKATARSLLIMSLPAHVIYFFVIRLLQGPNCADVTLVFLGLYLAMAVLQVAILLYLAQNLVNLLWRCEIDPDNYSTPILTAIGDLLGCAFLLAVFILSAQFGDPNASATI